MVGPDNLSQRCWQRAAKERCRQGRMRMRDQRSWACFCGNAPGTIMPT
jgi:hypothetical protein